MSRHLHRPGAAASHGIGRAGPDLCAALFCAGLLVHGALAGAQVVDRILAVVDRQVITLADVRLAAALRLVPAREEAEVLDRLVERTLVLGEVARYAPGAPSEADVDARLRAVRTGAGEVDVDRALRRAGLDAAWLRAWVRQALLTERYLDQRFGVTAVPTDDQVEEYYRARRAEFTTADGGAMLQDTALPLARERLTAERRARMIADWMVDLRRRAVVELRSEAR